MSRVLCAVACFSTTFHEWARGAREKEEGGSGEKQEETLEDGMREKLENEKLKETDQSGTKEQQPEIFQSEKSGGGDA